MTRTREQTNDYQLGYSRAKRRSDERWRRRVASLIEAIRHARRALTGGMGRCRDCRHYERGGPTHHWGWCKAALGATSGDWELTEIEGWAHADIKGSPRPVGLRLGLAVHQSFGCTKFDPPS